MLVDAVAARLKELVLAKQDEYGYTVLRIEVTAVVSDASTVYGVYGAPSDVIVSLVPGGAYRGHSHLVCAEAIRQVVIHKGQWVHVTGTISDADSPTHQWAGTTFHMDSCTVAPA